jgi:hypothetical protein
MTVEEAVGIMENVESVRRRLQTLHDVGLDYLTLGQPATTLSGGEAPRIEFARERGIGSPGPRPQRFERVLSLGQRLLAEDELRAIVEIWSSTPFEWDREAQRVAAIDPPSD